MAARFHRVLLLVPFAAALLLSAGCEAPEKEEIDIGYRGEARFNPYLAAAYFLEEMGMPARSQPSLDGMPPYDTLLLVPIDFLESKGMSDLAGDWVESGGHLAVVSHTPALSTPWHVYDRRSAEAWYPPEDYDPTCPLFERFGIEFDVADPGHFPTNVTVEIRGEQIKLGTAPHSGFRRDTAPRSGTIRGGNGPSFAFLSLPVGLGRLSLINDATPLSSRFLQRGQNARFLWRLARLHRSAERAIFVYGSELTFFGMLLRHGWMPLVALAVFVAVWLVRNARRFGPMLPDAPTGNREFSEHIRTTGEFLWRQHRPSVLVEPMRNLVRKRLHGRTILHTEEEIRDYLAERCDLPPERVESALGESRLGDPAAMVQIVRDLQTMETTL